MQFPCSFEVPTDASSHSEWEGSGRVFGVHTGAGTHVGCCKATSIHRNSSKLTCVHKYTSVYLCTMNGKFVAYYRVSTAQQGKSGLGLEAQQSAVKSFLNGGSWELLEQFTEVESGKRKNRPQLEAALAMCKKQKATLVIAKLDRLARNLHFISGLMEAHVNFVAVDMPTANRLTVHILAAVAEEEARAISARTKAALASAKERGVILGTNGAVLAAQNHLAAVGRADELKAVVEELRCSGFETVRSLTQELNRRGIQTPQKSKWHPTSVQRLLKRLT